MEPRLYYDGHCALCHRAVRFAVRRDRGRPPLRFAPLGGASFERRVPAARRRELPDSVLLLTPEGELLARTEAVRYLLARAGGLWRLAAALLAVVPRRLADGLYDLVARRRRRWFGRAAEVCPALPAELRRRFEE